MTTPRRLIVTGTCLQGHSPACPHSLCTLWHGRAEWLPPHQSFLAPALQWCAAKAGAGSCSPSLPRDFCLVPWDTAGWLHQQLAGQRRKPAAGDKTQRTTSLPHANGSLCWQRLTVPQLLAQALSAKECQEFPCSQAGISEQDTSKTLFVSSCGLLCSALPVSSQASPLHHRALCRQHTCSHSHIVFCRHAVPGGLRRGTALLPRRQAQILRYRTTDSALGRRALSQETERDTTHDCCPVLGPGVTSPPPSHSLAPR